MIINIFSSFTDCITFCSGSCCICCRASALWRRWTVRWLFTILSNIFNIIAKSSTAKLSRLKFPIRFTQFIIIMLRSFQCTRRSKFQWSRKSKFHTRCMCPSRCHIHSLWSLILCTCPFTTIQFTLKNINMEVHPEVMEAHHLEAATNGRSWKNESAFIASEAS